MNPLTEFQVIEATHYTPQTIRGNYTEIENIMAVDAGGQKMKLRRFIRPDENRVLKDRIYRGIVKPKRPEYDDQIVDNVEALNGWHGDVDISPWAWDMSSAATEEMQRSAKFEAYGDLHTAAPIVAGLVDVTSDGVLDEIQAKLLDVALVCREVRHKLTQLYIDELGEKHDDDGI